MGHNQSRGFTLVELLVVISIIGLVASAVLYNLESAKMKGRDAKRIQDVENIVKALFLYESITGNKMGTGSGCGDSGNGFGWFARGNVGTYQTAINECLRTAGATQGLIQDPSGNTVSSMTAGFAYMIGYPDGPPGAVGVNCIKGKTRYVYAKLEGRAVSPTALDTTCEMYWDESFSQPGIGPGMNYFKKFE